MKDDLQPLLANRLAIDDEAAERALQSLTQSPELRSWLRDQYRMDAALHLALREDQVDFPNRVRYAASPANPATEAFIARLSRTRDERLRYQARIRVRQGVFAVAAALLMVGIGGVLTWAYTRPESGQVLLGQVEVGQQEVEQIPLDQSFTVTGGQPAVISIGHDSRAELSPDSQAALHTQSDGSRACELDSGSGSFSLSGATRMTAGTASVTGDTALPTTQVSAKWTTTPRTQHEVATTIMPRQLEISVTSGKAQIVLNQQSQVLHPHETLILEMSAKHTVATSHRGFRGTVWAVANQVHDLALAVGDARLQRTCIIPKELVVTIDGQPGDPADIRRGDLIEVQFAPNRTDLVVAARITSAPPAAGH